MVSSGLRAAGIGGWDREEVGGVGARQRGVGPQPAVGIETGPDKIQPAARGIGPEGLRDDAVLGEQVDHMRVARPMAFSSGVMPSVRVPGSAPAPSSSRTYSTRSERTA